MIYYYYFIENNCSMTFWFYLQAEGENVDKLEKADILEFTVKHLQKITRRDPVEEAYKFQVSLKKLYNLGF